MDFECLEEAKELLMTPNQMRTKAGVDVKLLARRQSERMEQHKANLWRDGEA